MATHRETTHREIEIKREVSAEVAMPELSGLPGVTAVETLEAVALEAVYLDTPDLRLATAGLTLRRRTGGPDAGWHLKLPVAADERTEIQVPLGPDDEPVPRELAAAVRARVRAAPLAEVAVLRTRRTVHLLRDADGRVLAEVADDVVTSRAPGDGEVRLDAWREWEVELAGGDRALLAAALTLVEAAGATAGSPSKLARALGPRLVAARRDAGYAAPTDPRSAGAVLTAYLRGRRDELLAQDPRVRRDEPDSVHQMRVATRRLRSALATGRTLLAGEPAAQVRAELSWVAGLLGAARDAEVGRARFAELLAQEPAELVLGPVAERLDADRADAYAGALGAVHAALDSDRYLGLLDALDALVAEPPLTKAARARASTALPRLVRRDWNRLARAFRAASLAGPGPDREHLLHEARKAAKRARHAGELVAPSAGKPALRFARATKKLADLLGLHHDSVEVRSVLRRVGEQADLAGEPTFTYGRLHALEQARAEGIEERLPALWDTVSARRRRRWLG
ncbi:CYTH and CHAD domain-containing protein [Pengzhenrongella sicca]|uniref:CYTH and CHAD domain-containing protein n=1 Tax=Pengzhenrongella sicca TaxID=2819238 RepID=A0A8A4ZCP5_9MICO|nr:CYTH and CHAD domain-containing protein [Pengzhenrongella sicca]QTE28267.1 CYTH and CHAD domain-containing protein [Pengzhenrongella sicca]